MYKEDFDIYDNEFSEECLEELDECLKELSNGREEGEYDSE